MLNLIFVLTLAAAPKPATNPICPVLGNPVNASSPKVVVNNREYRVCCMGCDAQLKATPGKFLNPDGTPRNAK